MRLAGGSWWMMVWVCALFMGLAPIARAETLTLKEYSARELLERVTCEGGFRENFCTLLPVFETAEDFGFWLGRCHAQLGVEALYEQPDFACTPDQAKWNTEPMGLLTHLSIRFLDANARMRAVFRHYLEQGRPEAFSALLNRRDSRGRTHLDILHERESSGRYYGHASIGMEDRKSYACALGGRYAMRPQPPDCQRRDKLFSEEFIQRARDRATE